MPPPFNHRLIILSGAGPGAGKSTTAEWLSDQLAAHHIPAHWIYEDHICYLDEFSPFVTDLHTEPEKSAASLLKSVHQFVNRRQQDDMVYISDALFPCTMWLYGAGYRDTHVIDLCDEIMHLLSPLNPLLFHLQVDVDQALERALIHRGEQYLTDHLPAMNKWPLLREAPIHTRQELVDLFTTVNTLSLKVIDRWPKISCVLDTSQPFEEIQSIILDQLSLEGIDTDIVHSGKAEKYEGRYIPDTDSGDHALVIYRQADDLRVNRYWPAGCRLICIGDNLFRLQGTDHTLTFKREDNQRVHRVCHHYGNQEKWYQREN